MNNFWLLFDIIAYNIVIPIDSWTYNDMNTNVNVLQSCFCMPWHKFVQFIIIIFLSFIGTLQINAQLSFTHFSVVFSRAVDIDCYCYNYIIITIVFPLSSYFIVVNNYSAISILPFFLCFVSSQLFSLSLLSHL